MKSQGLTLMLFVLAAAIRVPAQDNPDYIKVLIFDSGEKPSEALKRPEYELRAIHVGFAKDPELLCDEAEKAALAQIKKELLVAPTYKEIARKHTELAQGSGRAVEVGK